MASLTDQLPTQYAITTPVDDAQYGPIQLSEEYLQQLRALVHPYGVLQKSGYILRQFSEQELIKKKRCQQCCRMLPARSERLQGLPKAPVTASSPSRKEAASGYNSSQGSGENTGDNNSSRKPIIRCKFHPGRVAQRKWTCCNGNIFSPPCKGEEEHTPRIYAMDELSKEWRFYTTPPSKPNTTPAAAVVIDCEMGTAVSGESELIRISVVDYFSRTILLDNLVLPDIRMAHYNTRFSGVTRQAMDNARRGRTCIFGRANARKALWKFIGPEAIVIGHAGHQDLTSLRWIHPNVVDTLIIETRNRPPPGNEKDKEQEEEESEKADVAGKEPPAREVGQNESEESHEKPKKGGGLSLKALAQQRLNRLIQLKGRGHDSVEDSIATRDILHWNITKLLEEEKAAQPEVAMSWN